MKLLMIAFFITLAYCNLINLHNSDLKTEFGDYCQPKLKFFNSDQKLVKLISVFRHGERSPLQIENDEWKQKNCKVCTDKSCDTIKCDIGMLTENGFKQAKDLGAFIKNNYLNKIDKIENIIGYYSPLSRTQTTLKGVIEELGDYKIKNKVENSIVNKYNSNILKNIFINSEIKKNDNILKASYITYDNAMTSICSSVPFNCGEIGCDTNKIMNYVKQKEKKIVDNIEASRKNLVAKGLSLGDFGIFLEKIITDKNQVILVSGHDSTLIKLLMGLNIQIDKIPAYSSAIFIELWEASDNKKYFRVVYDGKIQKIGLFKEEYVEQENFMNYLKMFNTLNEKLKKTTDNSLKLTKDPSKIDEMIESVKNVYKPLIDELKKRGIDMSNLYSGLAAGLAKLNLKEKFKLSLTPFKQYLFEGWFGKSKSKPKETVQVTIDVKDKETGKTTQKIVECETGKDGNCKIISKDKAKDSEKKNKKKESTKDTKENKEKDVKVVEKCDKKAKEKPCETKKVITPCEEKKAVSSCEEKLSDSPCEIKNKCNKCANSLSCDTYKPKSACDIKKTDCDDLLKKTEKTPCEERLKEIDIIDKPAPCLKCNTQQILKSSCATKKTLPCNTSKTTLFPDKPKLYTFKPQPSCNSEKPAQPLPYPNPSLSILKPKTCETQFPGISAVRL